jgi:hypothetical protein
MPKERFILALSDELGDNRSKDDINNMLEEIRIISNNHGFDLDQWGSEDTFRTQINMVKSGGDIND